jgi:MscS family membrane protein
MNKRGASGTVARRLAWMVAAFAFLHPGAFSPAARAQSAASQALDKVTAGGTVAPASISGANDPLGRGTPRGTVFRFLQAAQLGDFKTATQYLQLTPSQRNFGGESLAKQLLAVLDRGFTGDVNRASDQPDGTVEIGLPRGKESIGNISINDADVEVILVQINDPTVGKIWLFSSDTLSKIPEAYDQLSINQFGSKLPGWAAEHRMLGMPLWQWLAMLILVPVSAGLAFVILQIILLPIRFWIRWRRPGEPARGPPLFGRPLLMLMGVTAHAIGVRYLTIPLLHRAYYMRLAGVAWTIAGTWFVWTILRGAMESVRRQAIARGKASAGSLMILGQRIVKVLLVAAAFLFILRLLGLDMTTALAGVGLGGLAVALGAQKTIENLIAGLFMLSDETILVGETCKFGDQTGTIEDISLRAVRIRTAARTEVSIPNGALAAMSIENLSRRDKLLFQTTLGLRYETRPDQLRAVLVEIRRMLYEHPMIEQESARIRFVAFGESSLRLELFSYVMTTNDAVYLSVCEDILMRIMDIVKQAGTALALRSQTLYMTGDTGLDMAKTATAENAVGEWRKHGDLPFPDFHPDDIPGMRAQTVYPAPESSVHKKKEDGSEP